MKLIIFFLDIPPKVGGLSIKNSSFTNLTTRQDFPTPESPNKTILKLNVGTDIITMNPNYLSV